MPDHESTTAGTPPSAGLSDPRAIHPAPEITDPVADGPPPEAPTEAPDVDTPAWEGPGPDPGPARGLVDPRAEVPDGLSP